MMTIRRALSSALVCAALMLSLWASSSWASTRAHGQPWAGSLGPVPQNCPPTPGPHALFDVFSGLGRTPVWALANYLHPGMNLEHSTHTRHGWGFKVLWLTEPGATSKVTVRGWNLRSGKPVWFSFTGVGAGTHPVLNPKRPGAFSRSIPSGWASFPSEVYVPSAGCYVLYAQWKEGAWLVPFAAGGYLT